MNTARQSRNQKKHLPRRHGDTENQKQQPTVKVKNLNTENTEKLWRMRGAEEKTGMRDKNSSRHGTNLIVSSTKDTKVHKGSLPGSGSSSSCSFVTFVV